MDVEREDAATVKVLDILALFVPMAKWKRRAGLIVSIAQAEDMGMLMVNVVHVAGVTAVARLKKNIRRFVQIAMEFIKTKNIFAGVVVERV